MAIPDSEYAKMIRNLRVNDLKELLSYAGRSKNGKKIELQNRALNLLNLHSPAIRVKVQEIYGNRYRESKRRGKPRINLRSDEYRALALQALESMDVNSVRRRPTAPRNGNGLPALEDPDLNRFPYSRSPVNVLPQYPVNPEVRFRDLPFYDVLHELIRPTSLITMPGDRFEERNILFYFTPSHLEEMQNSRDVQVQLRMCFLNTSAEQEDELPASMCLKVNARTVNMPIPRPATKNGLEPKRPKLPVDISSYVKPTSTEGNEVSISWASSTGQPYVIAVYLVNKQNSNVLIKRLKGNGVRNPDHTTAMIKEKLCPDRDPEIATMSLRGSLMCPVGKIKMNLPCRAVTCTHLQCFDADLFLQMNERKAKWICPICDKRAFFKDLAIDGLFLDIIDKAPAECTEVQFYEDGSWSPVIPVKKQVEVKDASPSKSSPKVQAAKPKMPIEVVTLDSDSETEDNFSSTVPRESINKPSQSVSSSIAASGSKQKVDKMMRTVNYGAGPSNMKIPKLIIAKSSLSLPSSREGGSSDYCILGARPVSSGPGTSAYRASFSSSKVAGRPPTEIPESLNQHRNRDPNFAALVRPKKGERRHGGNHNDKQRSRFIRID